MYGGNKLFIPPNTLIYNQNPDATTLIINNYEKELVNSETKKNCKNVKKKSIS